MARAGRDDGDEKFLCACTHPVRLPIHTEQEITPERAKSGVGGGGLVIVLEKQVSQISYLWQENLARKRCVDFVIT